ncbi:MAG: hypothetical protein WC876_10940, partial [Candidatus Thermoplasmatota archaeon]
QYLRIESIPSLLEAYLDSKADHSDDSRKEYIKRMKNENGTPLVERDFFGAAAYTQLLNLSMQPGWSLDIMLHLPRGYSFTYFNEEVESDGERSATLRIGADDEMQPSALGEGDQKVFLASVTHRKMVAFALLVALWAGGLVVAFPVRFLYGRYRLPRMKAK